jgi:hypothetical protein
MRYNPAEPLPLSNRYEKRVKMKGNAYPWFDFARKSTSPSTEIMPA